MKRLPMVAIALAAAGAAALGATACGDDSSDRAASPSAPTTAAPPAQHMGHEGLVAIGRADPVGRVLVDGMGMVLYSSEQEADGKIRCVDACTSIWVPLSAGAGAPTAVGDVGRLGVVTRPDGARQVTSNGRPLYTFSSDRPGRASGDGLSDSFGGEDFTWRAMLPGGRPAQAPADQSPGDDYGY